MGSSIVESCFCGLIKCEECVELGNISPVGSTKDRSDYATCQGVSNGSFKQKGRADCLMGKETFSIDFCKIFRDCM